MSTNRILSRGIIIIFLLGIFIISFNKIGDTDAWIHLTIGKLIFELKAFPEKEMFVYPNFDVPFADSYPFWLFGTICYLIFRIFDVNGLVIFKALAITAGFFVIFKDALRPCKNPVITALILIVAIELSHYRFVLRPDLLLMVFLPFSIFSLNAYLYDDKKYLYSLPFIHLIWANSHTSISLMFIPFMAFIAGGVIQQRLERRGFSFANTPSSRKIKTIAIVFLTSFAVSLINPYFFSSYLYGPRVMSLEWQETYITELAPVHGLHQSVMFGIVAVVLASFVINRKRLCLIHLLLVIPFLVLAFIAGRFIFFISLVALPVMARNISLSLESKGWNILPGRKAITAISMLLIIFYFVLTWAETGNFGLKDKKFGFGFDYTLVPKGAVDYMDSNGIYGRVINNYNFGQYIIWRGYPERTVFIDGKGYFKDLLRKSLKFRTSNTMLDSLYNEYGFESILIKYANPYTEYDKLTGFDVVSHPEWALVYWDDISLLYIRRGGEYRQVLQEDAYEYVDLGMSRKMLTEKLKDMEYRAELVKELERNIKYTGSSRARALLNYVLDPDDMRPG